MSNFKGVYHGINYHKRKFFSSDFLLFKYISPLHVREDCHSLSHKKTKTCHFPLYSLCNRIGILNGLFSSIPIYLRSIIPYIYPKQRFGSLVARALTHAVPIGISSLCTKYTSFYRVAEHTRQRTAQVWTCVRSLTKTKTLRPVERMLSLGPWPRVLPKPYETMFNMHKNKRLLWGAHDQKRARPRTRKEQPGGPFSLLNCSYEKEENKSG